MADEAEANRARQDYGSALIKKGAHAIGVEDGAAYGRPGFVVVAHVAPRKKVNLPQSLSAETAKGQIQVPVVIERSKPFEPE